MYISYGEARCVEIVTCHCPLSHMLARQLHVAQDQPKLALDATSTDIASFPLDLTRLARQKISYREVEYLWRY